MDADVATPRVVSWAHSWRPPALSPALLLSLLLHAVALVSLCALKSAPPVLAQGRPLEVFLRTPASASASASASAIKPLAHALTSTKTPPHTAHSQRPATASPLPDIATPPAPLPTLAATPSPPQALVTALSPGTGIGFSLGRSRSPWAVRVKPATAPPVMPPATSPASSASSTTASFHAALNSALSAMLQTARLPTESAVTNSTCQLTISTRTLSCSNEQLRSWMAAHLIWEQLPPPEVFGQPPQLTLSVATNANGQVGARFIAP